MDIITASRIARWEREQLAVPGISNAIATGAICAVAMLYGSVAQRGSNASNEFEDHVYRCHRPSWNPGKLQPSLRSVINLYAAGFQKMVSAQRNLGFKENLGLQGKLRMAVRAVEHRVSERNQPQRPILMLKMRRHENDFMLRGEDRPS